MVFLMIGAMLLLAPMLLIFYTWKDRRSARFNNSRAFVNNHTSRGEFLITILIGYLSTAILLIVLMALIYGTDGLSTGFFIFLFSAIYSLPLFLIAAVIGYPVYQLCSKIKGYWGIWIGYSIAALFSAIILVLIAILVGLVAYENISSFLLLMSVPSVVLATPTSVVAWHRKTKSLTV